MLREIYLDNAATTRVDKEIADLVVSAMCENFGNPSSVHAKGLEGEHIIKEAKKRVLDSLGYSGRDANVIFTSCGTESNNMAAFSAFNIFSKRLDNIVISDSEHPSVEMCAKFFEEKGIKVHRIKTLGGKIDLDDAKSKMNDKTFFVSCMLVNNETGAIFDVKALKKLKDKICPKAYFHVDAIQGFSLFCDKIRSIDADLISISGHKIYAPKGIGALVVKKGIRVLPMIFGGGQQDGLRSGTQSTPLILGFGKACENARENVKENFEYIKDINKLAREKLSALDFVKINSDEDFAPHILSISVNGIRSEIMLRYLSEKGIYVSAGSACSSKSADNRVLSNFGLDDKTSDSTLRVSFSKYNTKEDVDALVLEIQNAYKELVHNN